VPSGYQYPAFNAGPRECLGKRLALVEIKTCLAFLLPHMSFNLAIAEADVKPNTQMTIGMANGLPCFVASLKEKEDVSSTDVGSVGGSSDADSTELLAGAQSVQKSSRLSGRSRQRKSRRMRVRTPSPVPLPKVRIP